MKRLSPSTLVLSIIFFVLLTTYLGFHVVNYEAAQHERKQLEQQPSVLKQRQRMAENMLAINAATQKARDEVVEKWKELDKAGIHGEQKKVELLKEEKKATQEMNRTLEELRRQQ